MKAAGVSVGAVVQAIEAQNRAAHVGRVQGATNERTIRLEGRLRDPAAFERLVLAERGGRIIHLGQIASARDGTEEARSAALFNGRPAVGIDVLKTKGTSTTTGGRSDQGCSGTHPAHAGGGRGAGRGGGRR